MKSIFQSDYDTSLVPQALRLEASRWYVRYSKHFTFQIGVGFAIFIFFIALSISDNIRLAVSPHSNLLIALMLVAGCISIGYGYLYSQNRKSVIKKYLLFECKEEKRRYDALLNQTVRQNIEYWDRLGIDVKKKMIMNVYSSLSSYDQGEVQDIFLDILNQKEITIADIPDILIPQFDIKESGVTLSSKRLKYLKSILDTL